MTNALNDIDAAFTKQTGIKVVASYDASSALMKQIEGGAAADAFVSADLKWPAPVRHGYCPSHGLAC